MNHHQYDENEFGYSKSVRKIGSGLDSIETGNEPMNAEQAIETHDDWTRNGVRIAEQAGANQMQIGGKDAEQIQLEVYASQIIAKKAPRVADQQTLFEISWNSVRRKICKSNGSSEIKTNK